MAHFPLHDIDDAPEGSRPILEGAKDEYGFLPNLLGVMATSPALLEAYTSVAEAFDKTSLTPGERQVVLLATSHENGCEYCMAAHSAIGMDAGLDEPVVEALRAGRPLPDGKLEALRRFTKRVVETRGWPGDEAIEAFEAAGYTRQNVLDVITGVGMKTLSNYTNHIAGTPLDEVFRPMEWKKAG